MNNKHADYRVEPERYLKELGLVSPLNMSKEALIAFIESEYLDPDHRCDNCDQTFKSDDGAQSDNGFTCDLCISKADGSDYTDGR